MVFTTFLERRILLALLVQDWGVAGSFGVSLCGRCSSKEGRVLDAETRLRVIVLDSGVPVRLATWEGGRTSPIEIRGEATDAGGGGGGWEARVLNLREDEPLGFLACLVLSLRSLLMTSTKALLIDARFKDCRMELRVVGLDFGEVTTAVLDSAGIVEYVIQLKVLTSYVMITVTFYGFTTICHCLFYSISSTT